MAFQGDSIFWVEVDKIVPNPFQPRREFDESKLKELSESIRMYGVLQPLTVTRKEVQREDGAFYTEYELIAGERRLRASKLAGLAQVPVIIREGEDSEQEKLELAIIENLQREDLNAVDRALAFRQLADVFGLSHAAVASKVGRSREYVSNTLRLLQLPNYMLDSLKVGDISEGHARTLLMLNDKPEQQDTIYREILLKKLSVREVERITRKIAQDKVRSRKWKDTDPELIALEQQFTETLGTRVQIAKTDYGGKLTIDYFSPEDLDKLLALMQTEQAPVNPVAASAVIEEVVQTAEETNQAMEAIATASPLESATEPEMTEGVAEEPQLAPAVESPVTSPIQDTEAADPDLLAQVQAEARAFSEDVIEVPDNDLVDTARPSVPSAMPSEADFAAVVAESTVTPEPIQKEEEVKSVESEDDSDLYTIKNFNV